MKNNLKQQAPRFTPYLSAFGLWGLAFGCAVGQGAFVMPGNTFLPIAGPVGTAIGIALGALVMLVLAKNFHYLMNRYPGSGGTYTYTKQCFGYDHGFLSGWFLILCYVAILWANATALPIVARTLLGSTFQFGFHYEVAGFHVYFGEILLSVSFMTLAAVFCLRRRLAAGVQAWMGVALLAGVVLVFVAAVLKRPGGEPLFTPAYSEANPPLTGIFTILALAPWAYAGFESVSHSAAEAKFPLKKTFRILFWALLTGALAYGLLALLASVYTPEGIQSWPEYVARLGEFSGPASQPTFYAAQQALGDWGCLILGLAAFCGIFTGMLGNFIALSRLVCSMTEDDMMPRWLGKLDEHGAPRRVILTTLGFSIFIPLMGRTAISWIVDVTTVGATIAYAFASAAALRTARREGSRLGMIFGGVGLGLSVLFVIGFLVPSMISVTTLATESYLILAAWCLVGYGIFLFLLRRDENHRLGRSNVALIVMLGVIIFTSTIWMRQDTDIAIERSIRPIQEYYVERMDELGIDMVTGATRQTEEYLRDVLNKADASLEFTTSVQIGLIVATLAVLFAIYAFIQKRERKIEVEKALAEESSRAKTSFLSNMSHEIRTPMNAIIGLDNIALRDPDLTPKTREHLEKIGSSARHLLGLVNDILDMSRIESGRMVLKDEEFSFRELVDQVNIIINGQCVDKGLRYECVLVGRVGDYFVGDSMKLRQVLINILGNSVKFTEAPGSVTLTVEKLAEEEGISTLRFAMKDTGIGMDKAYIPKIFEAFSQEDATSTNKYGGSGLGMAITKNFVEMMGGDIEVESEKGVGSVFTVTVPLKSSARTHRADEGEGLPEGLRALVVDDDEIACEHAKLVLEAIGIGAETASSARKGLEQLRAACEGGKPFDLLLTDYKMPDMNGQALARAVRAFDGGATAILMLTGYNWDIIEEEVRRDGVDAILAKPLFTDNLIRAVKSMLEHRRGDAPQAEEAEAPAHETVLAGRRILMAEDVDANAEILADLLELEDMESERAENGQRAVELFRDHAPGYYDLILMDVRMPVMDGLAATETIRALPRPDAKTIPIIAMTANVFDEDVQRSLEAGMNAHLSKPVEPDRLYAKMAELLQNQT